MLQHYTVYVQRVETLAFPVLATSHEAAEAAVEADFGEDFASHAPSADITPWEVVDAELSEE